MGYLDITFQQYHSDIRITEPIGGITLYDYLYNIKFPTQELKDTFKQIEVASSNGDLKLKANLKKKLTYFTPCVKTNGLGRSYSHIEEFTGLMIVDVDGLDVEYAKEFKTYLFETYSFMVAVFLSVSKRGVKAIVRIPKCQSVEEFKSYFFGLSATFQEYKGYDSTAQNPILANFVTYDEELLYRTNATVFDRTGIRIDEFKISEEPLEELTNIDPKDVEGIKLMLQRMMAKIDVEQQGHLILRNTSLIAGGLTRYIPMDEMQEYMFELIDNSSYLQKGLHGYRKTCMQMLKLGATNQIDYER